MNGNTFEVQGDDGYEDEILFDRIGKTEIRSGVCRPNDLIKGQIPP